MSPMTAEEIRQQYALTSPPPPMPLLMQAPVQARRTVTIEQVVQTVTEEVTVRHLANPTPPPTSTHLAVAEAEWGWEELRDYVVGAILDRFGVFPRDTTKEMGIFKSFVSRHGAQSAAIARHAFEDMGGYWKGAPIAVTRFCKGSDPYFAEPIKQTLANHAAQ